MFRCLNGHQFEESQSIHTGPEPGPCPVCEASTRTVVQTSLILFGDQIAGDDDFSRRHWNNGAKESSVRNKTQGQTNINAHLRKWGKEGLPLELNPGVKDRTKSWDVSMGTPPGLDPSVDAPYELQSSSARGMKLKDEPH